MSSTMALPNTPFVGLARSSWAGPRWLDRLDGPIGKTAWAVWLNHGYELAPTPRSPWVSVGTFPQPEFRSLFSAGFDSSDARAAASLAASLLIEYTKPPPDVRRGTNYMSAVATLAEKMADRWYDWPEEEWYLDTDTLSPRVWSWAGLKAGYAVVDEEVIIIALSCSYDNVLRFTRLTNLGEYHVENEPVLMWPNALHSSLEAALGERSVNSPYWPLQFDQEPYLNG